MPVKRAVVRSGSKGTSIEDAPLTPFHQRLTVYSSGGPFLDGYTLSIIGVALTQLGPQLNLGPVWSGLIGASALVGLFIGGFFGYLTDLVGRQVMYTIDLMVFIVGSVLQMFITNAPELFTLRLILGIAVGADYPIATSLLAEFAPKKYRGGMLGMQILAWYVGATAAYIVGGILAYYGGMNAWRWMLGSSAVPALVLVFMRWGTPESPRWLMSKGRQKEADKIVKDVFGDHANAHDIVEDTGETSFGTVFSKGYLNRILFVGLFEMLQVAPLFALYTFGPQVLKAYGVTSGSFANLGLIVISILFLIGCIPALFLVNKLGRRPMIIWSFALMTFGIFLLGIFPKGPTWIVFFGFLVYAFFSGGPNVLDWIYPNEIFPTEVRGTAVGIATSISRIGAFLGTFVLPIGLARIGIGPTMLIGAAVTFAGLLISIFMAPETTNKTLIEASSVDE
ncbi:MFS transporter [Alicyclobacillus sp. SO9]|uniref:MFS transporter n=1 Tax=Alicyclobacillus sp. SO9 TaxID=2665646 RepID=UPI0018E7869D|nr:MFS transporter [Alicyclobacillus sp. SO9]QQE79110.1 MFS transporter [Alicyclobacillus sp. SO9]